MNDEERKNQKGKMKSIKDLPKHQRPREKLLAILLGKGPHYFPLFRLTPF